MKAPTLMQPIWAALCVAISVCPVAAQEGPGAGPHVGDTFRIQVRYETQSESSGGNSGSSQGRNTYIERVVAADGAGSDREFSIPPADEEPVPLIGWQFPVRVRQDADGSIDLLNRAELEARRDHWLREAGLPHEACGTWYFTWNAFQIECDPDEVLGLIADITLPAQLTDGTLYQIEGAEGQAVLVENLAPNGRTYSATLPVDVASYHRQQAEAAVVIGQISNNPVSFEAAYASAKEEAVTGTVSVLFEADTAGHIWRRTVRSDLVITNGEDAEQSSSSRVTERQRESHGDAPLPL